MKHILGVTTAALLGASVLVAPAFAQATMETNPAERGDTTAPMPDVDTGTTNAIDSDDGGALSAITGSASATLAIEETAEFGNISVSRIGPEESSQVEQVVTQNQQSIDELRAAITANPAVQSELQAQNVDVETVVGAEVALNGDLTLYVM